MPIREQLSVQMVVGVLIPIGGAAIVTHQIQYVYVLIGQYAHNLFLPHDLKAKDVETAQEAKGVLQPRPLI